MVFLGRSSSLAVLALASSALAAPSHKHEPKYRTLKGQLPDDVHVEWVGPQISHLNVTKDQLAQSSVAVLEGSTVGPSTSALRERGIFGTDDRQDWPNTEYPYAAMGRITWNTGVLCSGTLVGPRIVATAKHCKPTDSTVTVKFEPNYYNGARAGSAFVTSTISLDGFSVEKPDAGSCDWKEDWALFILDTPLGNTQGYLGAKLIDDSLTGQPIFFNYGYPGDLANGDRPFRSAGSTVKPGPYACDAYGPYSTDTDVAGGQSGGPFWKYEGDTRYLYAICSGTSSSNSIFSGGNNLVAAINQARIDYP